MLAHRELTREQHASAVLNWEHDADGSFAPELRTTKIKDVAEHAPRAKRIFLHQVEELPDHFMHVEFGDWTTSVGLPQTKHAINDFPAHKGSKSHILPQWYDAHPRNDASVVPTSHAASTWALDNQAPSARENSYLRMLRNALEFCELNPTSRPNNNATIQRTFVEALGHIFSHTALPSTRVDANHEAFYFDWSIEGKDVVSLAVLGSGEVIVGSETPNNKKISNLRSDQLGRLSRELDKAGISRANDTSKITHLWIEKFKAPTITQRELVSILEQVNSLLTQGNFSQLSEAILSAGDTFNTSSAVAVLRLSFPARTKLVFWQDLKRRLEVKILNQGREPSKVLRGL